MITACAYIWLNLVIPLLIAFYCTTAPIEPYAFEIDPHRNQNHIDKTYYSSIQGENYRHMNSRHENSKINEHDNQDVQNLFEIDFSFQVYSKHLEETDPLCNDFYIETMR